MLGVNCSYWSPALVTMALSFKVSRFPAATVLMLATFDDFTLLPACAGDVDEHGEISPPNHTQLRAAKRSAQQAELTHWDSTAPDLYKSKNNRQDVGENSILN